MYFGLASLRAVQTSFDVGVGASKGFDVGTGSTH